ncbi:MAG TPA: inorganic phosphate transporter, partial [Coleofasciculaceae cyanobacterium]
VIAVISFTWLSLSQLKFVGQDGIAPAQLAPAPAAIAPSLAAQPASPAFASPIEAQLVRFQVLSACFVAFAHGANDVGNAIAPLAAIAYVNHTGSVPLGSFQTPFWVLLLGGTGIVAGLAVWGKKVIATVGQGIIPLQPSGGFCAQLATATTVLLASQLGLPVSTSHAIVGGVVGVGLVQGAAIQLKTLRQIGLVWVITIPAATSIAAIAFLLIRRFLTDQVVWSIASGR